MWKGEGGKEMERNYGHMYVKFGMMFHQFIQSEAMEF